MEFPLDKMWNFHKMWYFHKTTFPQDVTLALHIATLHIIMRNLIVYTGTYVDQLSCFV